MIKIRIQDSWHPGPESTHTHPSGPANGTPAPRSGPVSAGIPTYGGTAGRTVIDTGAQHHIGTPGADHTQSAPPLQLPERYIGNPVGALRSDPRHPGSIWIDDTGQRYLRNGADFYAARFDTGNRTWRVIQTGDPGKPGIPVREAPGSGWSAHRDAGGPAGQPDEAEKARLDGEHRRLASEHQSNVTEKQGLLAKIEQLERDKRQAQAEVSSMTSRDLPDDIWGPNLPQARSTVSGIEQDLSRVRSQLSQLESRQYSLTQQMEQVYSQLERLRRQ